MNGHLGWLFIDKKPKNVNWYNFIQNIFFEY
jgi:hypothetical protein